MHRPIHGRRSRLGVGAAIVLILAACGSPGISPEGSTSASQAASSARASAGEVAEIEWYVGLGTGTNPEQIPVQEAEVEAFNATTRTST